MDKQNNNQIDNTSYYRLPCGLYLEDFIHYHQLDFNWGSALKYRWRGGNKSGESLDKEMKKVGHYVRTISVRDGSFPDDVYARVQEFVKMAKEWEPSEEVKARYARVTLKWEVPA